MKYPKLFLKSHTRQIFVLILLSLLTINNLYGQEPDVRPLQPDQTVQRQMSGAETHLYKFDLKSGEFFQVRVEQKGVDVALKLIDAEGKTLATMDSPNGKEGPETLTFIALKDGNYKLEISGFDEKAEKGIYTINRKVSRTATAIDKRRVEVERLFVEGMTARDTEGQGEVAFGKLEEALKGWKELKDEYLTFLTARRKVSILSDIGRLYSDLGEYRKALEYLNQALPLYRELGDKEGEGYVLTGIGSVYNALGEQEKALGFLNQALPLVRQFSDKNDAAAIFQNIARIYVYLGEHRKALEFLNQALLLVRQVDDKEGEAVILMSIGATLDLLGEQKKALEFLNKALLLAKQIDDEESEASIVYHIGIVCFSLGNNQKALESFDQVLDFTRQVGNKSGEALALSWSGIIYYSLNEEQKALEYYNQALLIFKTTGEKKDEATVLSNIMVGWESLGNPMAAIFYGKQSVNKYQELRQAIQGLEKDIQKTFLGTIEDTYKHLADLLITEGRFPEAQAVLDLLKEQEFSGLLARSGNPENSIPYSGAEEAAVKTIERLASLGREKGELSDKNNKGSLNEQERQRFKQISKDIESAEAEFDKTLKTLSEEKNTGQNFEVVVKNAQAFMTDLQELGNGTVALYTVIVNETGVPDAKDETASDEEKEQIKTGWIILVTPQFRKAYPIDVEDLEQTIFQFRSALRNDYYDPQNIAYKLYQKLFQKKGKDKKTLEADLDEYFKDKTDKTLMWSLDGVLRYVPMAALHDGNQYLIEKYRNTVFNTASKARLKDAANPSWTVLGLGVKEERLESGKRFPKIEGVERELGAIILEKEVENDKGILPGTLKLDSQFTAETMQDALQFDKNPVVHISSHFSFNAANIDESFLLLGEGKMTVRELTGKSTLFSNVDLLALSACDTAMGTGNGKEVEGFAYVAQSLGAKSVLASLWPVSDRGTDELMIRFYKIRVQNPLMPKGEAFRQAQLSLFKGLDEVAGTTFEKVNRSTGVREKGKLDLPLWDHENNPPFSHPHYWSSFILIGNWR